MTSEPGLVNIANVLTMMGGKIVVVGSRGAGYRGELAGSAASVGEDAYELAGQILARLEAGGHTVAVAESLTGGLVAAALTDIPGASVSFRGGVVTYATELKASLLGVPLNPPAFLPFNSLLALRMSILPLEDRSRRARADARPRRATHPNPWTRRC